MTDFRRVLQKGTAGSQTQLLALHASLSARHSQIGSFLDDELARTEFLSKFPRYVENLADFLSFSSKLSTEVGRRTGTQRIAIEVVDLLVAVLSHSEFDLADTDAQAKLVITTLEHGVRYKSSSLKSVATKLVDKPGLLERVASSIDGAGVIKTLFAVHFVNAVPTIRTSWAHKLLTLCAACSASPSCHGIKPDIEKWRAMAEVSSALEPIQQQGLQRAKKVPTQAVPSLLVMRKLDKDEKKSRSRAVSVPSSRPDEDFPELSERVTAILNELQIPPPQSYRAAEVLLESLHAIELPALIQHVLETFPCRPCNELAKNPQALLAQSKKVPLKSAEITNFSKPPTTDSIFGNKIGLWKVLLSAEALKDIQRLSLAGNIDVLKARLLQLASGDWKGGNFFQTGPGPGKKHLDSPLCMVGVGKHLRILWQIDIGRCEDGLFRQHIKIWNVIDQKDIPKAIEHVVLVHRSQIQNPDDGGHFSKFPTKDASGINIPTEFHLTATGSRKENRPCTGTHPVSITVAERKSLELYNKFYEFTQPVMQSFVSKSLLAEFPFDASPEEMEIIKHDQSGTLIMGRSGTGKTTCLVQKIVWNCTAQRSVIGQAPIRQILLTRSKLLAEKLKVYTKRLVESQLSKTISTTQVKLDVHDTLAEESLLHSKTLAKLMHDDFPLVITFEGLLKIIENTVADLDRQKFHDVESIKLQQPGQYVRRAQTVDIALFRSEYWKQFPSSLTKAFEPGLVFAEILGVIKGSSFLHTGTLRNLSRDDYLYLTHKNAPTFSADQREGVYELYLQYERQKSRNGDKDGIDRVLSLVKFLRNAAPDSLGIIQGFMDEIYVDEVQDQRCIDIMLLLRLVKNPRGIHLAGDTAQCISQDSTFRFNDVKRMFFEQFSPLANTTNDQNVAAPVLFKLSRNFRSHQGIISLANFVSSLLSIGFPQAVDKMDEERGQYNGPIPTLFVGIGAKVLASRLIGLGDVFENIADFGAEQVILVRDESTKEKVREELGEVALVLTILDSKGMEFDDVFLLDFFTSSPCLSIMRRLKDIFAGPIDAHCKAELERNALLCSELKHLYVAVTRARNQLWIFESSAEAAEPVVKLWAENEHLPTPLVEVARRTDPHINDRLKRLKPAVSSDPKKYSEQGYQLLQRGLYREANFCFKKANDERGLAIAGAHLKMEEGRGHRAEGDPEKFLELFTAAVTLFRKAGQLGNAAFCLEEMNQLEKAGDIWVTIGQHEKAASLFMACGAWRKAYETYDLIESYAEAARALRQGELFDELAIYLVKNRDKLESSQSAAYAKLCTILITQGRIRADIQPFIVDALGSDEEKEEFFRKFKLTKQLVAVLKDRGSYGKAFRELVNDGNSRAALRLGLKHIQEDSSIPVQEVIKLVHYMEFEKMMGCLLETTERPQIPYNLAKFPRSLSESLSVWNAITSMLLKHGVREVLSKLADGLYKDFVSVAVAAYWRQLDVCKGATAITDLLPVVQALNRTVALWESIRRDGQELPLPIAVALGALPVDGKAELQLLGHSPLMVKQTHCSIAEAILWGTEALPESIIGLITELDEFARPLWKPQNKQLCPRYLSTGQCVRDPSKPPCGLLHQRFSSEDCRSRIEQLGIMSSLFCTFQVIYYGPGRGFRGFQGRKRFWLEFLLRELTFRSALENDCDALTNVVQDIIVQRTSLYAAIFHGLEELLFYRIHKKSGEWKVRNDLSSLLEAIQLSESLGERVAVLFRENIKRAMRQQHVSKAVIHIQRAIYNAKRNEIRNFRENVSIGLTSMAVLDANNFTCFHAIISLYERLATYLFLWTCPAGCLLPSSWAKLHVPVIVTNPSQIGGDEDAKFWLGESLIAVLESFIEVFGYLDGRKDFRFTFGTRKFQGGDVEKSKSLAYGIEERCRNFLVIALINLAAMPVPLRGSQNVNFKTQQLFFQHRNLHAKEFQGRHGVDLTHELHRSFGKYQAKDSLIIVTTRERKVPIPTPQILESLRNFGAPIHALSALVALRDGENATKTRQENYSDDNTEEDKAVQNAVLKLQAFWLKRRGYLHSHRAALETPRGKANAFVFEKFVRDYHQRNAREKVRKSFVMFTMGVEFYVAFWELRDRVTAADALYAEIVQNRNLSASDLEELVSGKLVGDLQNIIREVSGKAGGIFATFREEEVRRMFQDDRVGWENMRSVFGKANRLVSGMEYSLREIVARLERMRSF